MKIIFELSTGKKIELTTAEFDELANHMNKTLWSNLPPYNTSIYPPIVRYLDTKPYVVTY